MFLRVAQLFNQILFLLILSILPNSNAGRTTISYLWLLKKSKEIGTEGISTSKNDIYLFYKI